jgi:hypothetical protein
MTVLNTRLGSRDCAPDGHFSCPLFVIGCSVVFSVVGATYVDPVNASLQSAQHVGVGIAGSDFWLRFCGPAFWVGAFWSGLFSPGFLI